MTDERAEIVEALRHFLNDPTQAHLAEVPKALLSRVLRQLKSQAVAGEAVAWKYKAPSWSHWKVTLRKPINSTMEDIPLYTTPQPAPVDAAVERAVLSKDLYQVLMDVQNGIDSPALKDMANSAIRMIDKARTALAAQQQESGK